MGVGRRRGGVIEKQGSGLTILTPVGGEEAGRWG